MQGRFIWNLVAFSLTTILPSPTPAPLAPGEGVLLYAGTGSVSYHQAADGTIFRAGGYGYLIDDAGAGLLARPSRLSNTSFVPLTSAVNPPRHLLLAPSMKALGSDDWDGIIGIVYGGGRSRVAALAPSVAHAAEQGDSAALLYP